MADLRSMKKLQMAVQAARLYYGCDESQAQIAHKLNISRPHVSRLLQLAREQGIVEIHVNTPPGVHTDLEQLFVDYFGIKDAVIIPLSTSHHETIKKKLAAIAADYIYDIAEEDQVIGLPWGSTLNYVAEYLKPKDLPGTTIVQLKGGVCRVSGNYDTQNPVFTLARKLGGTPCLLPVPSIVENERVKKALLEDERINEILNLGKKAEIAVFSIGVPGVESVLVRAGYFTGSEMLALRSRGAVGDICSRYFTIDGRIFDPQLNARTIGIELEQLKRKKYAIAVAGGIDRARGILGALRGGYINVLITDEDTAKEVLRLAGLPEKQ
jgi:deoxyribonucleoside regulator